MKDTETAPSLLDFSGSEVLLENITVDVGDLRAAVIVRADAKLIIENTLFDSLGTGLVIYSNGEVFMNNCNFTNCAEGIQIHDNAKLTAKNCSLTHFKEYAIRLETQKYLNDTKRKCGSLELLEKVPEISLYGCKSEGNGKGDVILKQTTSFVLRKQDESMET